MLMEPLHAVGVICFFSQELEKGNELAFATGKAARKKEREAAAAFRDGLRGGGAKPQSPSSPLRAVRFLGRPLVERRVR